MAPVPNANPDDIHELVKAMDRAELTHALLNFRSKAPLDFAPDFLNQLPLDQLRHLLWTVILCLTPA